MQLYFVRHGESEANLLGVFSNRGTPHSLTKRGREQVESLARKLQNIKFDAFYSSPLLRATQSADILAAHLGLSYITTPALTEYDVGVLEGRSDPESWRRYYEVRDAWLLYGRWDLRIEGGESFEEIRDRFMPLLDGIRATGPSSGDVTLLLGHGGLFACMLPLLLSNVDHRFVLEHGLGHTDYVLAEVRGCETVCVRWGEVVLAMGCGR